MFPNYMYTPLGRRDTSFYQTWILIIYIALSLVEICLVVLEKKDLQARRQADGHQAKRKCCSFDLSVVLYAICAHTCRKVPQSIYLPVWQGQVAVPVRMARGVARTFWCARGLIATFSSPFRQISRFT